MAYNGYGPDVKRQNYDEERYAEGGQQPIGWVPITHDKMQNMRQQDMVGAPALACGALRLTQSRR